MTDTPQDTVAVFPRSSGVLLHPTSLPGRYGIGDLGKNAFRFVDWLAEAGQSIWQILPLGPTGYADSPYQTLSAFAGNPNLISLDKLVDAGWLSTADLNDVPGFPIHQVDYGWVIPYHEDKLKLAFRRFNMQGTPEQKASFEHWCSDKASWLDDFALFITLKIKYNSRPWVEWPEAEALRDERALINARHQYAVEINEQRWRQWVFFTQWTELRAYAAANGVRLIGDLPIFVAHDSADVWANRQRFFLDEHGNPTVIAGVPPDYFAATGQRWGNPLYRWDVLKADGYSWWISRIKATLEMVDMMRIDHFRGFEAYWEIPAEEETAINGKWVPGPGADFFEVVKRELGELPIIAEDLGVITPEVDALRKQFNLPGMKVLQFAWSNPQNPYLPHQHEPNSIIYTGTHDNNTTLGWWQNEVEDADRQFMEDYLNYRVDDINWAMIRLGMMSVAHTFIAPMQDIISYGAAARMNTPGVESGNWTWRFPVHEFDNPAKEHLAHVTYLYQRRADQQERPWGDPAVL